MDRTRRLPTSVLCGLVWGPEMGFHSESFRFEGGGRHIIIGRVSAMTDLRKEQVFLTTHKVFLYFVGLNRTGKSCRLRWVNYLHPGLKRGKMSPQEERLVLELHAKWGNRWSRIARKLPGRTDNEIKNYWRTHMRKKAQEKKRANNSNSSSSSSPSPSRSSSSNSMKSSSSSSNITTVESLPFPDSTTGVESFYDTGGRVVSAAKDDQKKADDDGQEKARDDQEKAYCAMDDIWKEIALPEVLNDINIGPFYGTELGGVNDISEGNNNNYSCPADPLTMVWDDHHYYCSDSLWKMDGEANKAPFFFGYEGESLTG